MEERRKLELMEYHLSMVYELSTDLDVTVRSHTLITVPIWRDIRDLMGLCVEEIQGRLR